MELIIYLQGKDGETDIENRLMDMRRGKERVRCLGRVTRKLTLLIIIHGVFFLKYRWYIHERQSSALLEVFLQNSH